MALLQVITISLVSSFTALYVNDLKIDKNCKSKGTFTTISHTYNCKLIK